MKLSIIIPLYNSENYISLCLDSIFSQDISKEDFEVIIINDESTDGSLSILNEYASRYSNLNIYSQKNQGASIARNKGIDIAKGKYLYFIDSDDYIAENTLGVLMNDLNDDIDLLAFKTVHIKNLNSKVSKEREFALDLQREIISGAEFIARYGFKDEIGWYIVKKEFLLSSNLFFLHGKMLEDISFNISLLTQVRKVIFIPLDVYRYVCRPNSVMTRKSALHNVKMILDYERVVLELEKVIQHFKTIEKETSTKLREKQKIYHFFLFTRLIRSGISVKEISSKLDYYKKIGLYPLEEYGIKFKTKFLVFIFNHKFLLFFFAFFYRIFSKKAV